MSLFRYRVAPPSVVLQHPLKYYDVIFCNIALRGSVLSNAMTSCYVISREVVSLCSRGKCLKDLALVWIAIHQRIVKCVWLINMCVCVCFCVCLYVCACVCACVCVCFCLFVCICLPPPRLSLSLSIFLSIWILVHTSHGTRVWFRPMSFHAGFTIGMRMERDNRVLLPRYKYWSCIDPSSLDSV